MKKILLLVFLLTLQSGFAQTLIPYPQFYVQKEDSFIINSSTMILIGDESFRSEAAWLSEFIQMTTGISLEVQKYTGAFPEAPCILVAFDASAKRPKPDEYKLNISGQYNNFCINKIGNFLRYANAKAIASGRFRSSQADRQSN